jgi:hypothetical protein
MSPLRSRSSAVRLIRGQNFFFGWRACRQADAQLEWPQFRPDTGATSNRRLVSTRVRCTDQSSHAVPVTGYAERPLQDAWRRQLRPAHTGGNSADPGRPDNAWAAHGRDAGVAQADAGAERGTAASAGTGEVAGSRARGPFSHLPLTSCYGQLETLAECLSVMRAVTALMVVCLLACGTSGARASMGRAGHLGTPGAT